MDDITIKVEGLDKVDRALGRYAKQEIPRIMRNSLNDTGLDARNDIRSRINSGLFAFKNASTRRWITNSVRQQRATKTKFETKIEINPARDQLALHEAGGPKTPRSSSMILVPARGIRTRGGQVKRGLGLKSLQPFQTSGRTSKLRRSRGQLVKSKRRGSSRTQLTGRKNSFWFTTKKGRPAIARRVKGKFQLLYIGRPLVKIPPSLEFHETAVKTVHRVWEKHAALAVEHAFRRAGLK